MGQIGRIGAVVLAGGLSTRMGEAEKSLLDLGGRPLIGHVIDRVVGQVDFTVINANGDPSRFSMFDFPVLADTAKGFAGPLAGLLAGMQWCTREHHDVTHLLSVAGDTPFFPANLCKGLRQSLPRGNHGISLAYCDGQRHPTFGLWPVSLLADLHQFLVVEGNRKIMLFVEKYPLSKVDFSFAVHQYRGLDPFFNVNTPEELAIARRSIEGIAHE